MNLPLEKQVCSLELSKKLKELGVPQESLFYWLTIERDNPEMRPISVDDVLQYGRLRDTAPYSKVTETTCAFTVAELGIFLPSGMQCNKIDQPTSTPGVKAFAWHTWMWNFNHTEFADTEADARAKMLIYLIEKNIIDVQPL